MTPMATSKTQRIPFLDNLRTFMIFLVVLYHAGLVYEASGLGAFFWIVDDPATTNVVGYSGIVLDTIIMPVIFFVSGCLAPISVARHSAGAFLRSKIRRLMVPWFIGVLTLVPLYKVIFLWSRGLPQQDWTTYFHWNNGIFGQSWLWFLPVLFVLNLVYLVMVRMRLNVDRIPFRAAVFLVFFVGLVYTVAIDRMGWTGWTKTPLLDFQNERLLVYFLVFLLGAVCHRSRIFERGPVHVRVPVVLATVVWIPCLVHYRLALRQAFQPHTFGFGDTVLLWACFQLSLLGLLAVLVQLFRFLFNLTGPVFRLLNRTSYGVYVVHTVVLGFLGTAMLPVQLPAVAKWILLTAVTCVSSTMLVEGYNRSKSAIIARRKR